MVNKVAGQRPPRKMKIVAALERLEEEIEGFSAETFWEQIDNAMTATLQIQIVLNGCKQFPCSKLALAHPIRGS